MFAKPYPHIFNYCYIADVFNSMTNYDVKNIFDIVKELGKTILISNECYILDIFYIRSLYFTKKDRLILTLSE